VLAVPSLPTGDARRRLLLRYGRLVASLGGTYRTAGDMNITPEDLDVVAETCPWVFGSNAHGGNSGYGTARGVLHGIASSLEHVFGSDDLDDRSVLVQGVGAVGRDLARYLAEGGARVLVADVDEVAARRVAGEVGAEVVAADEVLTTECDVYAPCAIGGTLSAGTIPMLACRIVAGSANNQLAEPEDADRLHAAAILYAPDYVINAGGVIQLVGLEDHGWDEAELVHNLARIGDTLRQIYAAADAASITTAEAAARLAAERIAQKRDEALA
jgi:leucine dehydrogenase